MWSYGVYCQNFGVFSAGAFVPVVCMYHRFMPKVVVLLIRGGTFMLSNVMGSGGWVGRSLHSFFGHCLVNNGPVRNSCLRRMRPNEVILL